MNSTTGDYGGGFFGSKDIGGFGYGIGVSVGILLLITSITLASYFCTRSQQQHQQQHQLQSAMSGPGGHGAEGGRNRRPQHLPHDLHSFVVDIGLDDATIRSYPKLPYSEAKLKKTNSTSSCCSICLADYKATDMLRQLPDCTHLFHVKCVDPWLRLHPTCPVCRTSPIPTPLSTPLAEVVPLATRRG
ncbi:RING-H2 finger protein ATL70-like [Humulus lupulus]|uniref:RING-H2 finger protein ATL70-like n=1 Tax=Humulus lupulus TaxID=3486 RepID=UPI002B401BEF|nr:RING-H2 finger protein ATL70-like [Humulus lupulus]